MKSILYIGNKLSQFGFTPGVIETLGGQLQDAGFTVSYAGTFKNQGLRLLQILYKTITKGRQADYILIDTYSTKAFWYAYLAGRLARISGSKYILILHGGNLPARLIRSKRACNKLFNGSYANVAVSGYLQHEFEKAGYSTIVIPNNLDISLYPFKKRENPRPKLLWVRSFHHQYNPNMAGDVLAGLIKEYPDSELCMVGPDKDGSMAEFKKYIKTKGIEDHVTVTGRLPKSEWIKLSENYDFFINTTNVDNTPVSVIEAMALGLCVVSTDPGGITWLLKDGKEALLVKPNNSTAMAGNINHLIKNFGEAQSLSVAARKKAELFDWNVIKASWFQLLS